MKWDSLQKPAETAEQRLVYAILDGTFLIDSTLPPERELSTLIGVTRPTLREALQRLGRDGWLEIHHGKPTRVRDYWKEGSLSVLSTLAKFQDNIPNSFVDNLLQIRLLLSPSYTSMAVKNEAIKIFSFLSKRPNEDSPPEVFSNYDWKLHQFLTQYSGNPIFTLILNGFEELYALKGIHYFQLEESRKTSINFYEELKRAAKNNDPDNAYQTAKSAMMKSIDIWQSIK